MLSLQRTAREHLGLQLDCHTFHSFALCSNQLLSVCMCVCVGSAHSAFVHGQRFVVTSGFSLCRVLLRVRMLYYLKQEVIGSQAQKVLDGVDSR